MTNRTLIYLTAIVLLGMLGLFALNMNSILTGTPDDQTYLKYNDVRGSAVSYHQHLYTLNFKQQNSLIEFLNRSVRIQHIEPGERENPEIDQMTFYLFNQPDVHIYPITYVNHNLIYSAPQWDEKSYFMELSEGDLQHLLSQTYDR